MGEVGGMMGLGLLVGFVDSRRKRGLGWGRGDGGGGMRE